VTPPGQYKASELVSETKKIQKSYETVYRNIKNGFRSCSSISAYRVDDELYHDNRTGLFDVTLVNESIFNLGGVKTYIGRVKLKGLGEKTTSVTGSINDFHESHVFSADGSERRARWFRWAEGNLGCEYSTNNNS
jgi:hypothetical protein